MGGGGEEIRAEGVQLECSFVVLDLSATKPTDQGDHVGGAVNRTRVRYRQRCVQRGEQYSLHHALTAARMSCVERCAFLAEFSSYRVAFTIGSAAASGAGRDCHAECAQYEADPADVWIVVRPFGAGRG